MTETSKGTTRKAEKKSDGNSDIPFPMKFSQAQERGLASMARANAILVDTARTIWENEVELFRQEAEQARSSFAPLQNGHNPMTSFPDLCARWHESSERSIQHLRAIQDQMRNCEWKILELFAENMAKPPAE